MTEIKICGITNLPDSLNAIAAGANYLGFIFVASSVRSINESEAKRVLSGVSGRVKTVAVFKNNSAAEIEKVIKSLPLDFVQLHGSESPEFCKSIDMPVIKAIEIGREQTLDHLRKQIDSYKCCKYILFDKPKEVERTDWLYGAIALVESLSDCPPYFFAGGLNHTNVQQVLNRTAPFALDVASAVESAPGKKDMEKMAAFCNAVKQASQVINEAVS